MPNRPSILLLTLALASTALAQTQPASQPATPPPDPNSPAALFPTQMPPLRAALAKKDPVAAIAAANALVAAHPARPEAYLVRAEVHAQLKRPDDARADILKALDLSPGHIQASIMLAALAAKSADYQPALESLGKALARHPNNTSLLAAKADIQALAGLPAAADTYRLAIDSTPDKTRRAALQTRLQALPSASSKSLPGPPAAAELQKIKTDRQPTINLTLAFQKNPSSQPAIDALVEHVRKTVAPFENAKDTPLIPLHESELSDTAPDTTPPDIQKLRDQANALVESLSIPPNLEATDPVKAKALFDQVLAIYPDPWTLLRRALLAYHSGDLKAASQDAALACAIDSLHKFQHPTGALTYFRQFTPDIQGRRLLMQLDRLRANTPDQPERELNIFTQAIARQDWVQAQETHRSNRAQWRSELFPLGQFVSRRDYQPKVFPQVQKFYAQNLTSLIAAKDDPALRKLAEEAAAQPLTDPDAIDALIAAWTKLAAPQELEKAIDSALKTDRYNPSARISQGKTAEAQNRPVDAMLYYNIGACGNPIKDLSGRAVDAADARDRIEQKLTLKVALPAYSDYLAKELDNARPGSRKLPTLECAITRFLPYAQHPNDMLFYRGEVYFNMKAYHQCIADMRALIGKQEDLQHSLWCYIGDSSKNLAADLTSNPPPPGEEPHTPATYNTQAVEAYTKAIPLADPGKPLALGLIYYARANCLQALGQPAKSAPDYAKAISLLPDDKTQKLWAYHELARAQDQLGDKENAYKNALKAQDMAKNAFPRIPGQISGLVLRLAKDQPQTQPAR